MTDALPPLSFQWSGEAMIPLAPKLAKAPNGATRKFVKIAAAFQGDECLRWPYGRPDDYYPKITTERGSGMVASRAVCQAAHGDPPTPQHQAAHSCGNGHRGCVNPKHLRWATPAENSADRDIHGTSNKGERHGLSKLTNSDVIAIRERLANGETQDRIAAEFGIAQSSISRIKHGECWGWLKEDAQ